MRSLLPSTLVLVLLAAPASALLSDDESANDAVATAGIQILNTGEVTVDAGRLSLAIGDLDFLGISGLRAGDRITASTTPLDSPCPDDPICGGRDDFEVPDTILGIFDASGTRVCVFDDAFNNEDDPFLVGLGSLCRFLITTPGDYYVGVTGFSATPFDGNHFEFGDYAVSVTVTPLVECGDGVDNDGDGDVDLADGGCDSALDPSEAVACDDGLDNDGDGDVDFPADLECDSALDPFEAVACDDGLDNDGDGLVDFPADPGCDDAADLSERSLLLTCDDGLDNDTDGRVDFDPVTFANPGDQFTLPSGSGDPGCNDPSSSTESPQCQDGINNDLGQDPNPGHIDYDAGYSANGSPDPNGPDPQCAGRPWKNQEKKAYSSCGLGGELAFILPPLIWLSSRRRRRAA